MVAEFLARPGRYAREVQQSPEGLGVGPFAEWDDHEGKIGHVGQAEDDEQLLAARPGDGAQPAAGRLLEVDRLFRRGAAEIDDRLRQRVGVELRQVEAGDGNRLLVEEGGDGPGAGVAVGAGR
jgi:hypothetical protein